MNQKMLKRLAAFGFVAGAALALVVAGCGTTAKQTGGEASVAKTETVANTGAQLWAENCTRCHNLRPPTVRSDAEWEVNMLHMRVRANLTAEEYKKILEFLKSAN